MTNIAQHWSEVFEEDISIKAIRAMHVPGENYRFSPNRYNVGVSFLGTSKGGRLYVLSGTCFCSFGDWRVDLQAGMFVDFPSGDYKFGVTGSEPVHLVKVWMLPEKYRAPR